MPLKIRCPHCRRVLMAEDDTAGRTKRCPACDGLIDVPFPTSVLAHGSASEGPEIGVPCVRCGHVLGPGTQVCRRCHTDRTSGRRLPWRRRLAYVSARTWLTSGVGFITVILVAFFGVSLWLNSSSPADGPRTAPPPAAWVSVDIIAGRLFEATTPAARVSAREELRRIGAPAVPAVATALAASLKSDVDPELAANQQAAIELLLAAPPDELAALLRRCAGKPALWLSATVGLARLGDEAALDELRTAWLTALRRKVFVDAVADAVVPTETRATAKVAASRRFREMDTAVRLLAAETASPLLSRLFAEYWQTWNWLGQDRGEDVGAALFGLASGIPDQRLDFDERKEQIRNARRTVEAVAENGPPAATAAAGVILAGNAPQYESARRRIMQAIAAALPAAAPGDQQKLTWALARLHQRVLGTISAASDPDDVGAGDVVAALRWSRLNGLLPPAGAAAEAAAAFSPPPALRVRVITPRAQLAQQLLAQMRENWSAADAAVDRWLASDLPVSAALREALEPGQRNPNYHALAAALAIVAVRDERSVRPQLELWSTAIDQPSWVRALAACVLASFEARSGSDSNGWLASLDTEAIAAAERDAPSWAFFGHVVAAGGPPMIARLQAAGVLPAAAQQRLLDAARQAAIIR